MNVRLAARVVDSRAEEAHKLLSGWTIPIEGHPMLKVCNLPQHRAELNQVLAIQP